MRASTSFRYSALQKRPITSPHFSVICSILRSFSRLPVIVYRKDSLPRLFVRW